MHRVQRCNRNFTLVQDNSKSLYPPLSWESFENAFVTFAKVISSAPAFIFIEASFHALGDKKQHTELTLQSTTDYYAVFINICLFWSFYLLTLVKRSIFCHWAWYWRFYLHRRVGHLNCDIHIFIFIFIFLRYKADLYRREGHLSDWSWTLCGSTPDYQRSAVLNHLGKSYTLPFKLYCRKAV